MSPRKATSHTLLHYGKVVPFSRLAFRTHARILLRHWCEMAQRLKSPLAAGRMRQRASRGEGSFEKRS